MKRIVTLMLAFATISFSASAQQQRQSKTKQGMEHGKHGKGEMMKDLNLTDAQKTEMKKLKEEQKAKMEALKQQNLSQEEMQKARQASRAEYKAKMDNILTADQKAKMDANRSEMMDTWKDKRDRGMDNKEDRKERAEKMKEELNLSNDQAERLKAHNQAVHSKIKAVRSNTALTEDQKKAEIKAIKEASKNERKNILTEEQIKKMDDMKKNGKHGKMKKHQKKQKDIL